MKVCNVFAGIVLSVLSAQSHAVLVVDGVGAGGTYATLQDAVNAYLASSTETTIQIAANTITGGANIAEGTALPRPLTIEAAPGFTPVIDGVFNLLPANDHLITLNNLKVAPTVDSTDAMIAAGQISAYNCIFDAGPGVTWGISAANTSTGTTGSLTLTSCTVTGWYCLVVGRAVENYTLIDTWLYTEVNPFHMGIIHMGNQPTHRGSGIGLGDPIHADGIHLAATTPRTVTLERCVIEAGRPVAWPASIAPYPHIYQHFTNLMGPFTATNTVFSGLTVDSISWLGWFDMPAHTQHHSYTHCTFRNMSLVPDAGAPPTEPSGSIINLQITNCLFDVPAAQAAAIGVYYYAIGGYNVGQVNFTGDANAYNTPPFSQNGAWTSNEFTRIVAVDALPLVEIPQFETTYYARISEAADNNVTDSDYHLNDLGKALAADKAVQLIPPVLLDYEKHLRPGGTLNDIGADEADAVAVVRDWSVY
jgi:hypothetical protein